MQIAWCYRAVEQVLAASPPPLFFFLTLAVALNISFRYPLSKIPQKSKHKSESRLFQPFGGLKVPKSKKRLKDSKREGLAFGHVSCYGENVEEEYTCLEECYVEVDCTALALHLYDFDLPTSKDLLDSVPCLCRSREAAPTQNGIQPSSSAEQPSTSSTAPGAATPPQATRQGSEVSVRSSAPCGMVVKRDSWDT